MTDPTKPTEMYSFKSAEAFEEFKKLYQRASAECARLGIDPNKSTFMFDDREWVVLYAKYVIEYLEMRLKNG
jgi:hypothetical protein